MPKSTPVRLSIPEPCSEDWNAMHKVGTDRRHCDSCAKNVTDFTQATDGQILAAYRHSGGNICGRFRPNQLDRNLLDTAQPASWWSRAATWLGLLFAGGTLAGQKTPTVNLDTVPVINYKVPVIDPACITGRFVGDASTKPLPKATFELPVIQPDDPSCGEVELQEESAVLIDGLVDQAPSPTQKTSSTVTLTGVVTDDSDYPLIGASILIVGTSQGTVTDFDGKFSLRVPIGSTIAISYTGYATKQIELDELLDNQAVQLNAQPRILDTLVVKAPIVPATSVDNMMGAIVIGYARRRPNTLFAETKRMLRRWKHNRQERAAARQDRKDKAKALSQPVAKVVSQDSAAGKTPSATPAKHGTHASLVKKESPLTVFPNPASGPVTLRFQSEETAQLMLEITNAAGLPIYLTPWRVIAGENQLTLPRAEHFKAAGTYIIRLVGRKEQWTEQLVVD